MQNNPSAFADAFWSVNSLKVYSDNGQNNGGAKPSSATPIPPQSQSVAQSQSQSVSPIQTQSQAPISTKSTSVPAPQQSSSKKGGWGGHSRSRRAVIVTDVPVIRKETETAKDSATLLVTTTMQTGLPSSSSLTSSLDNALPAVPSSAAPAQQTEAVTLTSGQSEPAAAEANTSEAAVQVSSVDAPPATSSTHENQSGHNNPVSLFSPSEGGNALFSTAGNDSVSADSSTVVVISEERQGQGQGAHASLQEQMVEDDEHHRAHLNRHARHLRAHARSVRHRHAVPLS